MIGRLISTDHAYSLLCRSSRPCPTHPGTTGIVFGAVCKAKDIGQRDKNCTCVVPPMWGLFLLSYSLMMHVFPCSQMSFHQSKIRGRKEIGLLIVLVTFDHCDFRFVLRAVRIDAFVMGDRLVILFVHLYPISARTYIALRASDHSEHHLSLLRELQAVAVVLSVPGCFLRSHHDS